MNFKDAPIQRKLTNIVMLTSGVALLLSCVAFVAYEVITYRKALISDMQTVGAVIAANSTAAIQFKDEKTAGEILSALKADPVVLMAGLYDVEGRLLATYPMGTPASSFPQMVISGNNHQFEAGHLALFYPVKKEDTLLGTLYLKADVGPMYSRLQLYGWIVIIVSGVAFLAAFILSRWLQKSISQPILELVGTAKIVSEQKNYLVRADKYGKDELGQLTEAFNHMLAQIHERDAALQASQERLKMALAASQTGIWDWDLKTSRFIWDDYTHHLFGMKPGTFGRTYESFIRAIHPQDRVPIAHAVEGSLKTGKEFNVEFQVVWPDGSMHQLASRGKAIFDETTAKPIRMTGVCLDITERKRAEEAIRTLNAELEERVLLRTAELTASTREMEAFTYSVSHDLRAPLRHIVAFAEILQEEFAPNLEPAARDYLQRIMLGARNMSQLVDDLLNLARIGRQGLNRQVVELNGLIDEVLQFLKPETETRQIEWKIGQLPAVECDPGLMKQVFANLISNAIKYTRPREKAVIEIDHTNIDDQKTIFVRDNGVGFNMKFADKLFGVFQRLHRSEEFEGTGVGLATVERIIHKHGGRVWASSELNKGATFYFTLESMNPCDELTGAIETLLSDGGKGNETVSLRR